MLKIKIINVTHSNWYPDFVNEIFEVKKNSTSYTLLDTPCNEAILHKVTDSKRREDLLIRLKNRNGVKLGVKKEHSILLSTITNNRQAIGLLGKEY